jgi:hypothetical protein
MAVPAKQNLTITRGDTESIVITMTTDGTTPENITGRTYRAQIRAVKDAATISLSFTCVVTNGAGGEVTLTALPAATSGLTIGTQYWDLEETNSGVVSTILAGTVNVLADVTR